MDFLYPTLSRLCISEVLAKVSATYLSGFPDISYHAYTDNMSSVRLSYMISLVATSFFDIDLSLNVDKCEFHSF